MQALDRIIDLTRQVEEKVDEGDWLAALGIDAERRVLLDELLADPSAVTDDIRAKLTDVLQRNRRTAGQIQQQKQELAATSKRLTGTPAALRAYRANRGNASSRPEDA